MDRQSRGRQAVTMTLILGAVAFGMVLASGANLTPYAFSSPDPAPQAVKVSPAVAGLPSFADLAEAVEPAVVSIQAVTIESGRGQRPGVNPFEFFFGPRGPNPQEPQPEREFRTDSGGSGFVVSPDGLIVTNNHVIRGASELRVTLNGRSYEATVKGTDPATDIALIQIEAEGPLRFLEMGDSDQVRVGDWIMAIGSPLSLDKSVTVGVVSAKGRSNLGIGTDVSFENFIQTDAAINFGNSGGPLINLQGQVIAVATAINYGAENIGFAVPANTVKSILPQLRDEGTVRRGYLGVEVSNLDFRSARSFGRDNTDGALITDVKPGTPAAKAGLEHGDIVLEVDGRKITETRDLIDYVSSRSPDSSVEVRIWRGGEQMNRTVQLAERPVSGDPVEALQEEGTGGIDWLGLGYQDLTPGVRANFGIPDDVQGVLVTDVEPTSPLYEEGIRPGQVLREVNGKPTPNVEEFEKVVLGFESGTYLRIYIEQYDRSGTPQRRYGFVEVP